MYVKWSLEPPASIIETYKIRADITIVFGFAARLVSPWDRACKCDAMDKRACNQDGHNLNYHCRRHCEFTVNKEDSDRLHSIIMALASKRILGSFIFHVECRARDKEKADGRIMDVKEFVKMLLEHINNLQMN